MVQWTFLRKLGIKEAQTKRKNYFSILYQYISPSLFAIVFAVTIMTGMYSSFQQLWKYLLILQLMGTILLQYSLEKSFLSHLHNEAFLKFFPEYTMNFILLQVLAKIIKWYTPFCLFCITLLGMYTEISFLMYSLFSILFYCTILLFQVALTFLLKFLKNCLRMGFIKAFQLLSFIFFLYGTSFLSLESTFLILKRLDTGVVWIDKFPAVYTNLFNWLTLFSVSLSTIFILTYVYKKGSQQVGLFIWQRQLYRASSTVWVENVINRFYSLNMSNTEKILFEKDVKNHLRGNRYMVFYMVILQLVYLGSVIYIRVLFGQDQTLFEHLEFSRMVLGWILIQQFIVGGLTFHAKEQLEIGRDQQLLCVYQIEISNEHLVTIKSRLLTVLFFPKIGILFGGFIMWEMAQGQYRVMVEYMYVWAVCWMIQRTVVLWRVKEINGLNSQSTCVQFFSFLLITIAGVLFFFYYTHSVESTPRYHVLFLSSSILLYAFHRFLNIRKEVNMND